MKPSKAMVTVAVVLCLFQTTISSFLAPRRMLQYPETPYLCNEEPEKLANTMADMLLDEGGLGEANAKALIDAGNVCCSNITAAIVQLVSHARSNTTDEIRRNALTRAAAQGGLTGCVSEAFGMVVAWTSINSTTTEAVAATRYASTTGSAASTRSKASLQLPVGGSGLVTAQSSAKINP